MDQCIHRVQVHGRHYRLRSALAESEVTAFIARLNDEVAQVEAHNRQTTFDDLMMLTSLALLEKMQALEHENQVLNGLLEYNGYDQ